jgi:hypothetical protein
VLQNRDLLKRLDRDENIELARKSYSWHTDSDMRYAHYKDNWGDHWYGFYTGPYYYWVRHHGGYWWWHDPIWGRWNYWHHGHWCWQNPQNPTVVYIIVNNNYYPSQDVQVVLETVPDPNATAVFDQGSISESAVEPVQVAPPDASASQDAGSVAPPYPQAPQAPWEAPDNQAWPQTVQSDPSLSAFPAADLAQAPIPDQPAPASQSSSELSQPLAPNNTDPAGRAPSSDSVDRAYSKDQTRLVEISGTEQRADLFDVSGAGEPRFIAELAAGVEDVQFFNQEIGSPINVLLFLNEGSFLRFDGQGRDLN